jgi:hypothetical protein
MCPKLQAWRHTHGMHSIHIHVSNFSEDWGSYIYTISHDSWGSVVARDSRWHSKRRHIVSYWVWVVRTTNLVMINFIFLVQNMRISLVYSSQDLIFISLIASFIERQNEILAYTKIWERERERDVACFKDINFHFDT